MKMISGMRQGLDILRGATTDNAAIDFTGPGAHQLLRNAAKEAAFAHVHPWQRIRLRPVGQGADDEDFQIVLFGWYNDGPGYVIADITCRMGAMEFTFDSSGGQDGTLPIQNIQTQFDGTWRDCDVYTIVKDFEGTVMINGSANVQRETGDLTADQQGYLDLNLEWSGFPFISAEINLGTADKAGVLWVPVS